MIGQKGLIEDLHIQVENGTFPRFVIIAGAKGSGKKTLANLIYKMFGKGVLSERGIGVQEVRDTIDTAYKIAGSQCIYLFADADTMSVQAKNALLKVTEEPPHDAYFIITVSDINTMLDTIRSRATIYNMLPYSREELLEYANTKGITKEIDTILELAETPGDVDVLSTCGAEKLYAYAEKVVDNVAEVSGANALKISHDIAFKEGDKGYDLKLFLKAFQSICAKRMLDDSRYDAGVYLVSRCLSQLRIAGINKYTLFDIFILDIRREWM